jgi:hypothetical protein
MGEIPETLVGRRDLQANVMLGALAVVRPELSRQLHTEGDLPQVADGIYHERYVDLGLIATEAPLKGRRAARFDGVSQQALSEFLDAFTCKPCRSAAGESIGQGDDREATEAIAVVMAPRNLQKLADVVHDPNLR